MTTNVIASRADAAPLPSTAYERFAGVCAMVAGVAGFLYAVAFILLRNDLLSALFLLLNGHGLAASDAELESVVMTTARGELEVAAIGIWLRQRVVALD